MTAKEKQKIQAGFAKHLNHLRKQKGYSLRELAARSGLEFSQVQRIEKGKINFAISTLMALVEGLNITPSELLNY